MSSTNFNFFQVFSALSASFPQPPPFDDFVRVSRPTPSCQALFLLFLISAIIYTNVIFCGLPFGQNACYHRVEYYLLNIDDTRFSMIAFLSHLTAGSTVLWVGRILLFLAAAWVVVRCAISLFGSREAPEVWGFVSLANGARYDLTHWENMVGRMRSADVRLNFPSVSRCHAAICRNDQGHWWVYPVNRSSGVLLNGARTTDKAEIKAGDCIAAGGVEMYFFPSSESDEARLARRRTEEQERRRISQAGTLLGVNLCQLLLFLQVFLAAKAEARAAIGVPVMAGFSGGPAVLFGKTGGYAIGYLLAALIAGWCASAWPRRFGWLALGCVLGCAACYALGTIWFMVLTGMNLVTSLTYCVIPYLPGDAIKIILAAVLTIQLDKRVPGLAK